QNLRPRTERGRLHKLPPKQPRAIVPVVGDERHRLIIDVVWHADFAEGEDFAELLYRNLNRHIGRPLDNKPRLPLKFWIDPGLYDLDIKRTPTRARILILVLDDRFMDEHETWARDTLKGARFLSPAKSPPRRIVPIIVSSRKYTVKSWAGSLNFLEPELRPLA